eukprot:jgi/Chrzof1/622/Cz01g22220.t1
MLQGNDNLLRIIQTRGASGTGRSQPVQGGDDSSDDGEEGGSGEGMDEDMQDAHTAVKAAPAEPQAPIIDEDGFQLVQSKRKGRR